MAHAQDLLFRPILPVDDAAMADIVRTVMPEFNCDGPGFAINDPEVDFMSQAYAAPRSAYFVVDLGGRILGGGGIAPLVGGDPDTCELRKMYFLPEARGRGAGLQLITYCLDVARKVGFKRCYLETMHGMVAAIRLYEGLGFSRLTAPLGDTGHFSCDRWYALAL